MKILCQKKLLLLAPPLLIFFIVSLYADGSSPLYITNNWPDSNAMLTMGRSILHGMVPFKDLIEQRGPVLYAIYALGALIKSDSFFGVFIMQTINALIIYYLSVKIARDLKFNFNQAVWIGLLGPLALYSISSYETGGSPEEFGFTSVLYLLYVLNHYSFDVLKISYKHFLLLGLNLSLIFWNNYIMMGSYVAFFAYVAVILIIKKNYSILFKIVGYSLLGFLSITFIILIYYVLNGALGYLFHYYIIQNLSYGTSGTQTYSFLMRLLFIKDQMSSAISGHPFIAVTIVVSYVLRITKNKRIGLELILWIFSIFFISITYHPIYTYYNLIWMPFFTFALINITTFIYESKYLVQIKNKNVVNKSLIFLIAVGILFGPTINNTYLDDLVVKGNTASLNNHTLTANETFAPIIERKRTSSHTPTILMANVLDSGFFLRAKTLPLDPYWHQMNFGYDQLPQMYKSFIKSLNKKRTDFVIVRILQHPSADPKTLKQQVFTYSDSHIHKSLWANYKVVASASNSENGDTSFVLFEKRK